MTPALRQRIVAFHQAPYRYALALTGGGSGVVSTLLTVPGGSLTVLEVVVPYSEQALAEYLGSRPEQACSAATGCALARRAYQRAARLAPGQPVLGFGCTASLATDRPKIGEHRFHLAVASAEGVMTYSLTLSKGSRDRAGEEAVLDAVFLKALAEALGMGGTIEVNLRPEEVLQISTTPAGGLLGQFFRGEVAAVGVAADGRVGTSPPPAALLPGAFNPVHAGHWGLAEAASRRLGVPVAFELSVHNADKPPLSAGEVRRRLGPFAWRADVWLTRAPTFAEKAALFPGTVFVVGADTAVRILSPRYYQESAGQMAAALGRLRTAGCRFLVAGRVDTAGRFLGPDDLAVPANLKDLFGVLPPEDFRMDLSSTQLRGTTPAVEDRPRASNVL